MSDHSLKDRLGRFLDGTWQGAKRVQGIQGGARAYALSLVAAQGRRSMLIVAATAREAENLYDDLTFFLAKSARCRRCRRCTCFLPGKFCRSKSCRPIRRTSRAAWKDFTSLSKSRRRFSSPRPPR
jgi:hypothetical protein